MELCKKLWSKEPEHINDDCHYRNTHSSHNPDKLFNNRQVIYNYSDIKRKNCCKCKTKVDFKLYNNSKCDKCNTGRVKPCLKNSFCGSCNYKIAEENCGNCEQLSRCKKCLKNRIEKNPSHEVSPITAGKENKDIRKLFTDKNSCCKIKTSNSRTNIHDKNNEIKIIKENITLKTRENTIRVSEENRSLIIDKKSISEKFTEIFMKLTKDISYILNFDLTSRGISSDILNKLSLLEEESNALLSLANNGGTCSFVDLTKKQNKFSELLGYLRNEVLQIYLKLKHNEKFAVSKQGGQMSCIFTLFGILEREGLNLIKGIKSVTYQRNTNNNEFNNDSFCPSKSLSAIQEIEEKSLPVLQALEDRERFSFDLDEENDLFISANDLDISIPNNCNNLGCEIQKALNDKTNLNYTNTNIDLNDLIHYIKNCQLKYCERCSLNNFAVESKKRNKVNSLVEYESQGLKICFLEDAVKLTIPINLWKASDQDTKDNWKIPYKRYEIVEDRFRNSFNDRKQTNGMLEVSSSDTLSMTTAHTKFSVKQNSLSCIDVSGSSKMLKNETNCDKQRSSKHKVSCFLAKSKTKNNGGILSKINNIVRTDECTFSDDISNLSSRYECIGDNSTSSESSTPVIFLTERQQPSIKRKPLTNKSIWEECAMKLGKELPNSKSFQVLCDKTIKNS